eukprot:NODE_945_length_2856_cov_0.287631.p1 type:complete len:584 gc:universal NODE_945_length_2856_cov_0.287631:82-1833(+)
MTSNSTSPRVSEIAIDPSEGPNMVARAALSNENEEERAHELQHAEEHTNLEENRSTIMNPSSAVSAEEAFHDNRLGIAYKSTPNGFNEEQPRLGQLRYKILMQILNAFGNKFTGNESVDIDEWLHQLEFLVKPDHLSSAEKAYLLVNSVRGRAFMVLTEGDSSNYEELKSLLQNEFRLPGAYMKSIQDFCNARQGKNQKVAGYYHYLSKKMGRVNDMARERYGKHFELIGSDLAVAIFTHGLNSDSVKEKLASKEFKDIKNAYQDAVLYEDVSQDFQKPSRRSLEPEHQVRKRFKPYNSNDCSSRISVRQTPERRPFDKNTSNFSNTRASHNPGSAQSLICFKCSKPGHYAKDCRSTRLGAITLLESEVELIRTNKSSTVLATVGTTSISVTIDSGADTNCISLQCAEAAGIKEMQKVKAPEVRFAGNNRVEPLGMISVPMKFHKHMEAVPVNLLVFKDLVPGCLLGIDGQDQFKIRLDREQDLVWIAGMPISLNCSQKEAQVNLGAMHLKEAFKEKLENLQSSKRFTTYYSSDIELIRLSRRRSTRCYHSVSSDPVSRAMQVQLYWCPCQTRAGDSVSTTGS